MQVQRTDSAVRMVGAVGVVLATALLQGYLSWQFVMAAGDKLGVLNVRVIHLVGGVGFTLAVAAVMLTWVLMCGSLHTGALMLGGIGPFRDLLQEVGHSFVILLAAAVVATMLWRVQILPAVVMTGSTLGVVDAGVAKTVAVMGGIQQSAYLLFGVRMVQIVAKGYRLPGWKAAVVVMVPVLLVAGLRYAYRI